MLNLLLENIEYTGLTSAFFKKKKKRKGLLALGHVMCRCLFYSEGLGIDSQPHRCISFGYFIQ